jgi:hypothetical protein
VREKRLEALTCQSLAGHLRIQIAGEVLVRVVDSRPFVVGALDIHTSFISSFWQRWIGKYADQDQLAGNKLNGYGVIQAVVIYRN